MAPTGRALESQERTGSFGQPVRDTPAARSDSITSDFDFPCWAKAGTASAGATPLGHNAPDTEAFLSAGLEQPAPFTRGDEEVSRQHHPSGGAAPRASAADVPASPVWGMLAETPGPGTASCLTDAVPASTSLFLPAWISPDLFLLPGDVIDPLAPGAFPPSPLTGRGPGACFRLPRVCTPPRSYRRKQKTSLTSHLFRR